MVQKKRVLGLLGLRLHLGCSLELLLLLGLLLPSLTWEPGQDCELLAVALQASKVQLSPLSLPGVWQPLVLCLLEVSLPLLLLPEVPGRLVLPLQEVLVLPMLFLPEAEAHTGPWRLGLLGLRPVCEPRPQAKTSHVWVPQVH